MNRVRQTDTSKALATMAAVAFISALLLVLSPTPSMAEYVGVFTKVEGRVDVLRPAADTAVPVKDGDGVAVGDFVRTKSDGKAEIVFRDKTVLSIAPGTRIRIDDYTFNPDDTREQGVISLFRGKVRSVVSKIKSKVIPAAVGTSSYKVKTPTTVMGVKGTDVFVYHKRGVTGVVFREGHGFVYNSGQPEHVVNLGAGQMTYVRDAATPPVWPKHVSDVELTTHLEDTTPVDDGGKDDGRRARKKDNKDDDKDDDKGVYGYSGGEGHGRDGRVASRYGLDDDDYDGYEDMDGYEGRDHDDEDYYDRHYGEARHDDDDDYVPYTESHGETLNHDDDDRDWDFSGASDTTLALNGAAMGSAAGRPFAFAGDLDGTSAPGIGTWEVRTLGVYSGVDVTGGPVDVSSIYHDDGRLIVGTISNDTQWSGGGISGGSTFGYGAEAPYTWISVGDVGGTFNPSDATFSMVQSGATVETDTLLAMIRTPDGLATLDNLNVPYVEVGRASISGSDGNLTVNMNDITFFAYSTGAVPSIWATGDVNGTYSSRPASGTTVNLTGGGLTADFTTQRWNDGKWTSTVDGNGTVGGSAVQIEGAAAGNYSSGSFTGSGAGIVK